MVDIPPSGSQPIQKLRAEDLIDVSSVRQQLNALFGRDVVESAKEAGDAANSASKGVGELRSSVDRFGGSILKARTPLEALITLFTAASAKSAATVQAATGLRSAGQNIVDVIGTTQNFINKSIRPFGNLILASDIEMAGFLHTLSDAPAILREVSSAGGQNLKSLVGALGYFGVSAEDTVKLIAEANNRYGLSVKSATQVLRTASVIAQKTNINFKDAFNGILNLNQALRGFTTDAQASIDILAASVAPLEALDFSPQEIQKFTQSFANFLGNLNPSRLAGISAFVTGGGLPQSRKELLDTAKPETFFKFAQKIVGGFEKGSAQRTFAVESLAKQFGIGDGTIRSTAALEDIIDQFGNNTTELTRAFADFRKNFKLPEDKFKDIQQKGFTTLIEIRTPLQNIEKAVIKVVQDWSSIFIPFINRLSTDVIPRVVTTFGSDGFVSKVSGTAYNEMRYGIGTQMARDRIQEVNRRTRDRIE
jgi:hypothetical protein